MPRLKNWIILTITGIILYTLIVFALFSSAQEKQKTYLDTEMNAFSSKIMSTLKTYEKFSNYVYNKVVNQPHVMELMNAANQGTEAEKAKLRQELYAYFKDDYNLIIQYDFRQLHFHLANGDSFLRFHTPELFGDNLLDVRESIRIANIDHRYVFGFEEGRVYNGFRFVYPLFLENKHVGSVEVSISMETLMSVLKDLYPDIDTFFIVNQEVVEKIVFENQQSNYELHPLLTGYYYDKEIVNSSNVNCISPEDSKCSLFSELMKNEPDILKSKESFNRILKYNGSDYLVQFKAIENIAKEPVAYFIGISIQEHAATFDDGVASDILLVSALFILLFASSIVYQKKQHELEILSSTDKLTGLYNRHKMLEIAEREMERFERYGSVASLILLDIDWFKNINDKYGHTSGDEVLKSFGDILRSTVRKQDIVARWGGEEFVVFLVETGKEEALMIAERCRKNIENFNYPKIGTITASLGVTTIKEKESFDAFINRADLAMYEAKTKGRNGVIFME
ncbi:MAG: diguanylate cyclase [Tissierellales bacterium]|nr:diguanylate cyclase [Tissierellales bacterium]MBN2828460.1 diguanylate cyclase [Tissierellales bacterium]